MKPNKRTARKILSAWKEAVLDRSIFFSFDRSGFERHRKTFFKNDLKVHLKGKVVLITGANSGLGFASAKQLAELGARVYLLCRNEDRGRAALEKIRAQVKGADVRLAVLDVSDLEAIRKFSKEFSEPKVDILIQNAGVLPNQRQVTQEGLELTLATNLIGPFLLTQLLLPRLLKAPQGRVIVVTSGGMYPQKLDLENLNSVRKPFSGVTAYANTKRAAVILTELWAHEHRGTPLTFNSMHPGWADTAAVRESLPLFWRLMKNRLRTPEQGADTILWLAVCERLTPKSGQLWFDRKAVPTHLFKWTVESRQERDRLWKRCFELSQLTF